MDFFANPKDQSVCSHDLSSARATVESRIPDAIAGGCPLVIGVLIVGDQQLFRIGLRTILAQQGLNVVAELKNGDHGVGVAADQKSDIALFNLREPLFEGLESIRRLTSIPDAPRVIVVSAIDDGATVLAAFRACAVAYLPESTPPEALVESISLVARGESVLSPKITALLIREFARLAGPPSRLDLKKPHLSKRETTIVRELARGANNREIAAALSIVEGTVKNHLSTIFMKLGVRDRTGAALKARELGLV